MGDASVWSIALFAFQEIQCSCDQGIELAHYGIEKRAVNSYNAAALNVLWLDSTRQ